MSVRRVAIIGIGMIGGSVGLALKEAWGSTIHITGIDHCHKTREEALRQDAVDAASPDMAAAAGQDIIFLCTPVLQIVPLIKQMLPYVTPGTIITDVGSTKQILLERLRSVIPDGVSYIGGHPMAGREKSGIYAADKELLRNKWYILTEGINASPVQYDELSGLLRPTGALLAVMPADRHDGCAAFMSHIPHVAAAALVNVLKDQPYQDTLVQLMGGGFKDTTRIASSDADMWADICMTNNQAMINGLQQFQKIIGEVIHAMETQNRGELYLFFSEAKHRRDDMLKQGGGLINGLPFANGY